MNSIKILCFGDVVGKPGRLALKRNLQKLKSDYQANFVIANGENAAGGTGIDVGTATELFEAGIDLITLGDHAFQKKDFHNMLNREVSRIIRPANYAQGAPGRGWAVVEIQGVTVGVCNLLGRVFMGHLVDCPFAVADKLLANELNQCVIKIVDFHAEATSEKIAMARFLDSRVSLIFGTHTHVQTADQQILSGGTGYITDLGMCGSNEGVIGMDSKTALKRFTTGLPHSYQIAEGEGFISGIVVSIDLKSGETLSIERIRYPQVAT
jgi:2',3'-cyclic-nucleotide 2'-phosphodiesterase